MIGCPGRKLLMLFGVDNLLIIKEPKLHQIVLAGLLIEI